MPAWEKRWSGEKSSATFREVAPGVLLCKFTGTMEAASLPAIQAAADRALGNRQSITIFFDTANMTGYQPDFRPKMEAWHLAFKPHTKAMHVLASSGLIAMAIAIVNMATGGLMRSHSKSESFMQALEQATREASAG